MIYTTYFAKLKTLPEDVVPISICAKSPKWYNGLEYKKLAPSYSILMEYKEKGDEKTYIKRYENEILNKLDVYDVLRDLSNLVENLDPKDQSCSVALVCFEKSSDFCHRHLVGKWLEDNGFVVKEWNN